MLQIRYSAFTKVDFLDCGKGTVFVVKLFHDLIIQQIVVDHDGLFFFFTSGFKYLHDEIPLLHILLGNTVYLSTLQYNIVPKKLLY